MKGFREFIGKIRRQSAPMKMLMTVALTLTGLMAFSMGVGGAAITESIAMTASAAKQPILLERADAIKNPTTLRVEIVREGNIICSGTATPSVTSIGYETRYSLDKPVANCPPLSAGDTVRSTWIQSSEVDISLRD